MQVCCSTHNPSNDCLSWEAVLCVAQMWEPLSFTYDAKFGRGFSSLGQGKGCAQLDHMDLDEKREMSQNNLM